MSHQKIWGALLTLWMAGATLGWGAHPLSNDGRRPVGFMLSKGPVWLGGVLAPPNVALYPGDDVRTGESSVAILRLKSGATAALVAHGELSLPALAHPRDFTLRKGSLAVANVGSGRVNIKVLDQNIVLRARPGLPAICRIAVVGETAAVFNAGGAVELLGRGLPYRLRPGGTIQFQAGSQPGGSAQQAGSVGNEIPSETIQRHGQTAATPLAMGEAVNWQDVVRTLATGRVRVNLLDGSVLNIGARSVMRIVKQVPQNQQTQILFTLGRMRAVVRKLTKPGSSFKVQTQTAVIGVVGTIFVVEAEATQTRVYCIRGLVTVTNINPAVAGVATLHPGQWCAVSRGLPPTPPTQATPAQLNSEVGHTTIQNLAQYQPVFSQPTGMPSSVAMAQLGVLGAAAGGSGWALVSASNASSSAQSLLNSANAANAAANAAATAASGYTPPTSPVQPVCGCP